MQLNSNILFIAVILMITPLFSAYGQYLDTVHKTDFQHEVTYSYNWEHTYLTSVSELRDSNLTNLGWSYIQFKQYDGNFNVINTKKYTDSIHFSVGYRDLTFFQNSYYFPKNNFKNGIDTISTSVVKFDTIGNIIWEKKINTGYYKSVINYIVKQQGYLYIYGWRMPNDGDDTEVYILKTDTSSNILQTKTFSSWSEQSKLLSPCADGGFLMSNDFFNQPKYDTKIYKLNNSLSTNWTTLIESSSKGTIVTAEEAPDGTIIFQGTSKHPLTETERSYIGKLNANGTILKDSIYDFSNGYDTFGINGSKIWSNNGFYTRGVIYDDLNADTAKSALYYFDYDLNLNWRRSYAKRKSENGTSFIKQLDNDFIVMAGYVFPDDSNSTADEWFMIVDSLGCENITCVASLSIKDNYYLETNGILLYPNPASSNIFIENEGLEGSSYNIYNSVGQESQSGLISNNQIDISDLPLGFYIFTTYHGGRHYKSSLIISR